MLAIRYDGVISFTELIALSGTIFTELNSSTVNRAPGFWYVSLDFGETELCTSTVYRGIMCILEAHLR
jgi:hypothetical protein